MQKIKNKILSVLKKDGIEVVYFKDAQIRDILFEEPAELALRIESKNINNWLYFEKKFNCCGKVANLAYYDNLFKFTFFGSGQGCEEELLSKNLKIFLDKLQKRYHTVCPEVERFSVLVKPTHRCNLDCKYCYDKPYREEIREDMSMETLDRLLYLLSQYAEKVTFIWHGGEPTLVGTEWFKRAYEEVFIKYPMIEFEFSIMSNGINLNDEWFELFEKYGIKTGISYNAYFQSKLRCSGQDNSSEKKDTDTGKKIEKMLKAQQEKGNRIGVIDVISGMNYKNQIEIYDYYKKNNINACMNHVFHTRQTERNNLEVSAEAFAEEFLKYFKYWLYDKEGISERAAEEALAVVIGATNTVTCKYEDCRYKWLGINPLGELYPCDRYYPEKYKIGTIDGFKSINEIFSNEIYQSFSNEVQKRFDIKCKECGYWFACKGECNGCAIESSGSAEGVEEFICELFRLKYRGVYEILRDLDWVGNQEINTHAHRMMAEKGFYSVKEIKDFIKDIGKEFEIEYDKDNLLDCSEYKIFRGINYMVDDIDIGRHVDFIYNFDEATVKINKEKRKKELMKYLQGVAAQAINTGF